MSIHDIYTPNQVSKVLGNLSRITLPFWTMCPKVAILNLQINMHFFYQRSQFWKKQTHFRKKIKSGFVVLGLDVWSDEQVGYLFIMIKWHSNISMTLTANQKWTPNWFHVSFYYQGTRQKLGTVLEVLTLRNQIVSKLIFLNTNHLKKNLAHFFFI